MPDPSGLILAAPFGTGSSADQNGIAEQTVMIFASAAARTTALSAKLREGMVTYRVDAKLLERYNGTSWEEVTTASSALTAAKAVVPKVAGGVISGAANGAGDVSWTHGLSWTPTAVVATIDVGANSALYPYACEVQNVDSSGITVRIINRTTNVAVTGGTFAFYWIAFGGYGV